MLPDLLIKLALVASLGLVRSNVGIQTTDGELNLVPHSVHYTCRLAGEKTLISPSGNSTIETYVSDKCHIDVFLPNKTASFDYDNIGAGYSIHVTAK